MAAVVSSPARAKMRGPPKSCFRVLSAGNIPLLAECAAHVGFEAGRRGWPPVMVVNCVFIRLFSNRGLNLPGASIAPSVPAIYWFGKPGFYRAKKLLFGGNNLGPRA